jgi:hypothetical protein
METAITDPGLNEAHSTLEHALMVIHGIADVLGAIGQCRDTVIPPNGISYLGGELEDAYEEASGAFGRICRAKEPQP